MNNSGEGPTYMGALKEVARKNPLRVFTLGIIPLSIRNMFVCSAMVPSWYGLNYLPVTVAWALGGIILSHPFEVARVMIQYQEKNAMFGQSWKIIRGIFATEGLAGLYRGTVPRTLFTLPTLVSVAQFR